MRENEMLLLPERLFPSLGREVPPGPLPLPPLKLRLDSSLTLLPGSQCLLNDYSVDACNSRPTECRGLSGHATVTEWLDLTVHGLI